MSQLPWFLPGAGLALAAGVLLASAASRRLDTPWPAAWLLIASAGIIASATLSPLSFPERPRTAAGSCDLQGGLIPLPQLLTVDDRSLNVLLFVPLGVAMAQVHRRRGVVFLAGVFAPFAIESVQAALPPLQRSCEVTDIFDNLTGLAVGSGAAALLAGIQSLGAIAKR
jgi:hypothetical protein